MEQIIFEKKIIRDSKDEILNTVDLLLKLFYFNCDFKNVHINALIVVILKKILLVILI